MSLKRNLKYLFILMILLILPIKVLAKNKVVLEADKTDLQAGDEITITAALVSDTKLYALLATLSYDENIFEAIDEEDFTTAEEWGDIIFNPYNKKFGLINKSGEILNNLLKVTLKVKDKANVGNTYITLNNISASDGKKTYYFESSNIEVLITKDAKENEELNINKSEVEIEKEEIIKAFTSKPAFITSLVALASLGIALIIIFAFKIPVSSFLYKTLLVASLFLASSTIYLGVINSNKKDVNDDGIKDYEDAKEIIKYLIDIKGVEQEQEEVNPPQDTTADSSTNKKPSSTKPNKKPSSPGNNNNPSNNPDDNKKPDINGDGNVDIGDAGDIVEDTTNKKYTVSLVERQTDYYLPKGTVTLEFDAFVNPQEIVKKVIIDGVSYDVIYNDSHYSVTLNAPATSGVHEFNFSRVTLDNGRDINVSFKIKKEILKDRPYVDLFKLDDKTKTLSFKLEDKDKAFLNGSIIITNEDGEEVINNVLTYDNVITYDFQENVIYTIKIIASYDLDSDKNNDLNNYSHEILYQHNFNLASNYNFVIEDVTITDAISKNEKLVITFVSKDNQDYNVSYIVIDGKEYNASKIDDNKYEVILDGYDTSSFGRYTLDIAEVALDNFKVFTNGQDYTLNSLTYNVLKYAPLVQNIKLNENKDNQTINVAYNLSDNDNTISSLKAILIDSTGKTLDTYEITKESYNKSFNLSYKDNKDGRYTVKFIANYNLGTDIHNYNDINIGEEEILTQKDIRITGVTLKTFPVKGELKYKIKFTLEVSDALKSSYTEFAGVTLNGVNYDGASSGLNSNEISFTIPNTSGVIELRVDRVKLRKENYQGYSQAFFSIAPFITKIDVLKDIPQIENLEITDENYLDQTVTFKFNVVEDKGGFNSGFVQLNDIKQAIHVGENTITFTDVPKDTLLNLDFKASYELDTNELDKDNNQNSYTDSLIHTIPYGLFATDKYKDIALTDVTNKKYLEKNENFDISFNITGIPEDLDLQVARVIIDNKEYVVNYSKDTPFITLEGYKEALVKDITIKEVILTNGKKVTLTNEVTTKVEVLKDVVRVKDFNYEIKDDNIILKFKLDDDDSSVLGSIENGVNIKIYDEDGELLETKSYSDIVTISKRSNVLRYYIKVTAMYDRDTTAYGENYKREDTILDEVVSIDKNYIELKDITDITLYRDTDMFVEAIDNVSIIDLQNNLNSYFVKITMDETPTTYLKIKRILTDNNKLTLILDTDYTLKEHDKDLEDLRIEFGSIANGFAQNEVRPQSFADFIKELKENPEGTITLKNNLDAQDFSASTYSYTDIDFKGTLNGNGYTIKNLTKPLFNSLTSAHINNLKLENITLGADANGTFGKTATNSTFTKVYIDGLSKNSTSTGQVGTLVGVTNNTTISKCRAINFVLNVGSVQQVGGLVGSLEYNSLIKNSYAVGKIIASYNFVGGLTGNTNGTSKVENSYAQVDLNNAAISCGIGCSYTGKLNALNTVNLSTNYKNGFINNYTSLENNYNLVDTYTESTIQGITNITKDKVNTEIFKEANFDSTIWNLNNISYDNLPTFNDEKVSVLNIEEVKEDYDEAKEVLYRNLSLLMPFYSSSKIIATSKNIDSNNMLATTPLAHIIPIDANNNVVTYLTTDNAKKIKKIKLIYSNSKTQEYSVVYDNIYDFVVSYRIHELKIDYTYNHYLINSDSQLVNNLTNYLNKLTYEDNLDKLTPSLDTRIYKDYYYEMIKPNLKEFVLKFLSNSNYTNIISDEAINDYLEKEVKKDEKLEKLLYVYNYLNRFYSLSFNGIMLNDLILYNSFGFNHNLTPNNIANMFLSDEKNFLTNDTNGAYQKVFSKYTHLDKITDLIEYFVNTLTNETPDAWYANSFKGYITEIGVTNNPDIKYTLWYHLTTPDKNTNVSWYNYVLPIITLPERSAYIISSPVQFVIGAQRTYISNPFNEEEEQSLIKRIASYTERMQNYYDTASGILNDAVIFNNINTVQVDKRYAYENGILTFQNPYSTEEPFHKNFNEVVNLWAYNDYNAATANGAYVIWRVEGILDGNLIPENGTIYEYTYHTWSHESAHNIDARLFLRDYSRRFNAGGEDYADGNLTQSFGSGDIVMNLSNYYEKDAFIAANLTPERINSADNIYDFYQKLFDTLYIMDYIEGKAFLSLSSEYQSMLAVQVSYPNASRYTIESEKPYYTNYLNTVYQTISKEDIEAMKLDDIDDLYDNKLVMYPGVIYSTITENRYGGENIYKVRWYQPHNDYGRPDSYSLKWLAYEMLGFKGYDNGYIKYYSNINSTPKRFANVDKDGEYVLDKAGNITYSNVAYKTDLMAIQDITGDPEMTIEKYKKGRFAKVEENLRYIDYIDVNEVYNSFITALEEDALNVINVTKEAWEKYPEVDDKDQNAKNTTARNNLISNARQFAQSTALRKEIYFKIKNATDDFRKEVYNYSKDNGFKEFTKKETND